MTTRRNLATFALLCSVAACGGGKGKTTTPEHTEPTEPLAIGTSAFPGVDWGDSVDAVKADYPAAVANGERLDLQADHGGVPATISFLFNSGALFSIDVAYPDATSMETCKATYDQLRAELAKSLGETGDDNMGSFWNTETADVSLTCNPSEDGEGPASLSMQYLVHED